MASKDILKKVSDALGKKASEKTEEKEMLERERRDVVTGSSQMIADALMPYLKQLADGSRITKEELKAALSEVQINVPESNVQIPEIKIPQAQVNVSVPEIKLPPITVPQANIQYPDRMKVNIDGVDNLKPLPVMMMGMDGKPFQFSTGSGGGGKSDFFTIKNILNSTGGSVIDESTGAMKITGDIQVTAQAGTTISIINRDGEYYNGDNPLPVTFSAASIQPVSQVSGHAWSTSVIDIFGSTGTNIVNPDGRLKVELPTGSSGLTDTELRASHLDVQQLSGTIDSVFVTGFSSTLATNIVDSSGVAYSGSNPVPVGGTLTDITNTIEVMQVSGANWSVSVSGITGTSAVNISDSSGVGYSGSNPVPVTLISGGLTSTIAVGSVVGDAVDDGSAPVQSGGIARTANPTAVSGGDVVKSSHDDLGRTLTRPVQVRDLIVTAYVSVTGGSETTLLAASAGSFHDMIMIVGSNASDAAVSIDIRAVTGGNIINTLRIPANGTAGWTPPVPWPQDATGNNWTVDGPDETGRTLTFSALFSREI